MIIYMIIYLFISYELWRPEKKKKLHKCLECSQRTSPSNPFIRGPLRKEVCDRSRLVGRIKVHGVCAAGFLGSRRDDCINLLKEKRELYIHKERAEITQHNGVVTKPKNHDVVVHNGAVTEQKNHDVVVSFNGEIAIVEN